MKTIQIVQVFL